jgi:glycosyltransferase involved in cell wall biosynthesis
MSAGAPVVTSSSSSLPEVAGDAALLADPYDVAAISESLRRILTEPGLAEELSARGRARAATFSWERFAAQTIELLRSADSMLAAR